MCGQKIVQPHIAYIIQAYLNQPCMPTFHALLVGVNTYQNQNIRPLNGCVGDVERLSTYLRTTLNEQLSLKTLVNEQATRAAIVEAFDTHLSQAGPDDTVLFYFSGHGCLEEVPTALERFNENRKGIEALCCYDSLSGSTPTLADKELRYLIYQLTEKTKARVVLLTDSCHSGGATRNIGGSATPRMLAMTGAESRMAYLVPRRAWKDFIFSQHVPEQAAQQAASLDALFPQGVHIHLAACASRQSAWEIDGRGVFTTSLLDVLQHSAGSVSFHDLHSRLRYQVRQRFDQSPELYIVQPSTEANTTDTALRYTSFIEGKGGVQPIAAGVHWDAQQGSWFLDKGAIHGIPALTTAKNLQITLWNPQTGKEAGNARITHVQPAECLLDIPAARQTEVTFFQASIQGLYLTPLTVWLAGEPAGITMVKNVLQKNPGLFANRNIEFVEERARADYQLLAGIQSFQISRNWEEPDPQKARPVCALTPGITEADVYTIAGHLGAIAHWRFVQGIQNPEPDQTWNLAQSVHFQIEYQAGYAKKNAQNQWDYDFSETLATFDCDAADAQNIQDLLPTKVLRIPMPKYIEEQIPIVRLKTRITRVDPATPGSTGCLDKTLQFFGLSSKNTTKQAEHAPFHVSMLYLGQLFCVTPKIEGDIAVLEHPGEEAFGFGQNGVIFKLEDFIRDFNWTDETFYLKLLISTTPFEVSSLMQENLPPPVKVRTRDARVTPKGEFMIDPQAATPDLPDWIAKMVEVRLVRTE